MMDRKVNVLVTGANGQLGQELLALTAEFPSLKLLPATRQELDITNRDQVRQYFDRHPVDFCLNCAAYTAVDQAENHPEAAHRVNVLGPEVLAEACREQDATLIHYSTDYVYHTLCNRPYREEDPTNPQSVYARTKLEGEMKVREALPRSIIVRTSWVYSAFGGNFVKTVLRLGADRDHLRVVYDQVGTPTYAHDLALATLTMLLRLEGHRDRGAALGGIYHYSNEGVTSWYDFAVAILDLAGLPCRVLPIESKDYPTLAPRPFFSVLNKEKIKTTFDLDIPHWRRSLQTCLEQIGNHLGR